MKISDTERENRDNLFRLMNELDVDFSDIVIFRDDRYQEEFEV